MDNEESRLWRLLAVLSLITGLNADIGELGGRLGSALHLAIANPAESIAIAGIFAVLGWYARR